MRAIAPETSRRALLKSALIALSLSNRGSAADGPFGSLPAGAWKNARQNGLVMIWPNPPANPSRSTQITPDAEPGERLIVAGQVFTPDGRTPVSGVMVYAYNTDAEGYYGTAHAEYPPRLYGWMRADAAGRFELRTIRSGSYPGMRVPAHIHFSAWGGGYPLQWFDELRFAGDRYITPEMLAMDAELGDFRAIQPLVRGQDGVLRCGFKIRLKNECNFRA
jgi:protocatechuate 3,4-dioxygenase beta subunit